MNADLRVVREKIDETNVRLGSLSEEVETIRAAQADGARRRRPRPPTPAAAAARRRRRRAAAGPAPGGFGASPSQAFESARSDYYMGQWSLAVQGFESYIKTFPKSDLTDDAQYYIGETHYMSGRFQDAVAAYDLRDRPGTPPATPCRTRTTSGASRSRRSGRCRRRRSRSRSSIKTYPDSDAGRLAKQALDKLDRAGK